VAVDLGGEGIGDAAGHRGGVGAVELRHGLVDVEGAGESGLRRDVRVVQAGQPPQQHIDLELGAFGCVGRGVRCGVGREQALEHRRPDSAQHEPAVHGARLRASGLDDAVG
jgi:hypothetical protein